MAPFVYNHCSHCTFPSSPLLYNNRHGIDSRDAANTATEAVRALQTASAQADPGDIA
jgi:hypothetical protein